LGDSELIFELTGSVCSFVRGAKEKESAVGIESAF
jgi:hypothetical protein